MNLKVGLIGLTLASFVLVPLMPPIDATTSQLNSWNSLVYENLDGIRQDYDFKQFSPNLTELVEQVVNAYKDVLGGAVSLYEGVITFFQNPAVLIFGEEDFSDDAFTLGYIPDGRMAQIIWQSTFKSNLQVVEDLLSESECTYIAARSLLTDYPWVQAYFFLLRNTFWPTSDFPVAYYCGIVY